MISLALHQALVAFDESALELLANKGLVRRAARDIEGGKVTFIDCDGDNATVKADGESVAMGLAGPLKAKCSCPAASVCRHMLAATLFLRALPIEEGLGAKDQAKDQILEQSQSARDEICEFSSAILQRFAGKAGWQAAHDIAAKGAIVKEEKNSVRIFIMDEEICYLLGQGLEGMVSKISPAKRKIFHIAALLIARRKWHINDDVSEENAVIIKKQAPDSGFLDSVDEALLDALRTGLNIAPKALEERIFALSVSSRADALPRLSALLRILANRIRERRKRALSFEIEQYLPFIAHIAMLVRILRKTNINDENFIKLAGVYRQDYLPIGDIDLVGMGAEIWRTTTGARGVSTIFYAPQNQQWYSGALARPSGVDPSFIPDSAYYTGHLFGKSPRDLSRSQLTLTGALASPQGRLSMSQGVIAKDVKLFTGTYSELACAYSDWQVLADDLQQAFMQGLYNIAPTIQPVLLVPSNNFEYYFDDLRQQVIWPIMDSNGQWLALTLDHNSDKEARIIAVELHSGNKVDAIVANVVVEQGRFALRPIAVVCKNMIENLGLDGKTANKNWSWHRFLNAIQNKRFDFQQSDRANFVLADALDQIQSIAEIGFANQRYKDNLQKAGSILQQAGFSKFASMATIIAEQDFADSEFAKLAYPLLTLIYALNQAMQKLRSLPYLQPLK